MDVFSALQTSVSGLRAQAYSLENISGNIANSQTTGFKRVDTSFVDLIPDQPANRAVAGSVAAFSRLTNSIQGDVTATGIATNMAINGRGFFAVQGKTGEADGSAVFGGPELYTRRGDFTLDKSGYLKNGAGYYLKGTSIDPVTGLSTGGGSGMIKISAASLPAVATTEIEYAANLPKIPSTTSGAELMTAASAAGPVSATNSAAFVDQTVSAGSLTVYTSAGEAMDMPMRWAKTANGSTSTWNLFYQSDTTGTATGSDPVWTGVGTDFTFDADGKLTAPSAGSATISNLTINGTAIGDVTLRFGATGLTSYASAGGTVTTTTLQQNGYASGTLDSLGVTTDGKITGSYSNGRTLAIAQASLVQFKGEDALKRETGGTYSQTLDSGPPITGIGASSIVGGNVEQSNTDIAGEFSKMIVTQQAYSANTRVITTTQQMISDILNVIR